jgi:hypothetical protein
LSRGRPNTNKREYIDAFQRGCKARNINHSATDDVEVWEELTRKLLGVDSVVLPVLVVLMTLGFDTKRPLVCRTMSGMGLCCVCREVAGEKRVAVFAIRDIAAGDEITFDYQWSRVGTTRVKCHCSTPKCQGFIGGCKDLQDGACGAAHGKNYNNTFSFRCFRRLSGDCC